MQKRILIIHGPNLNLVGIREKEIYGEISLQKINKIIRDYAKKNNVLVKIFQENCEGKIVDIISSHIGKVNFLIINPGALTHYSYVLRDCIKGCGIPTIEVHLSNIKKREPFRKKSVIKDVCIAQIYGLGINSYLRAIDLCLRK
ncbi:MAG: type II 3-dehydroquinate dehydratase [Elusimicrobiales bacterium]|nr:type II 3-dehydroquinate dehydratase [Elusimicrobiales bacterium]